MLWNQLNQETREHHVTCVELFYRLHCLAPTASICEDIICHALLDPDKASLQLQPPSCEGPTAGQPVTHGRRADCMDSAGVILGPVDILVSGQKC